MRFAAVSVRCVVTMAALSSLVSTATWGETPNQPTSPETLWRQTDKAEQAKGGAEPWVRPTAYRLFTLDQTGLADAIAGAPPEFGGVAGAAPAVIALPMPDGSIARFSFVESPIMAPELAAKYPEIKTYLGQGLDDPTATVRFDSTPQGFHAQVLSHEGAVYIDPYWKNRTDRYATYYKRDLPGTGQAFSCGLVPGANAAGLGGVAAAAVASGDTLRTYRLALAATGEYTQFHGGTKAAGMAAIVTAMNRVNGIYETELAIRMVLVANNDLLVFTNAWTDPYSNSDGFAMLGQNQSTVDSLIGGGNYDVGHVFSTGGGGVAGLGVVCWNPGKAEGVTGRGAPIGDAFYVDYVAHEMGHQFGGDHTFNGVSGSCCCGNRNGSTAYEPGSGSTIQAYAGICGSDDLQPHSDPYFHSISFDQMRSFVTGFAQSCAVITATGNAAPAVNAGSDHTIPKSTPFTLTGSAVDPNADAMTYQWEERDRGPAAALSAPDNGSIPLFRSFNPTTSPSRTFPSMSTLLSGEPSNTEKLPTTNRTMRFRLTARDNRAGGGGVDWDERNISVTTTAGPFQVTAPLNLVTSAGPLTMTWNVAGTDAAPVNTSQVNIVLSTDGGNTFPTVLAAATPNDGEELVTIPDLGGGEGVLKIEAVGNVFFALSGVCPRPAPPAFDETVFVTGRYLSFKAGTVGAKQAIRVTFTSLPAPYHVLNGTSMWVATPSMVSENGGSISPIPGFDNFTAATLSCDPVYTNFGAVGTIHVYHRNIIPGGRYTVQIVDEACNPADEASFSDALIADLGRWADVSGPFDAGVWTMPDDSVDVASDVVAILDKFSSNPGSPAKVRADLWPSLPDRVIDIQDVTAALDAFSGGPYPFAEPIGCP